MSVLLTIKYANNTNSGLKIDFPTLDEVANNKYLLQGKFYYTVYDNETTNFYNPVLIGKIGDITQDTEFTELCTKSSTYHKGVSLLFKFDDDTKNTADYNSKIFYNVDKTTTTAIEENIKYLVLNDFTQYPQFDGFFIAKNSNGDNVSYAQYTNKYHNLDSEIDTSIEEEEKEEIITDVNINVTLYNGYYDSIKSDIELFYNEVNKDDTETIIQSLGKFKNLSSNVITVKTTSDKKGIKLYLKYDSDNINNSTYNKGIYINSYFRTDDIDNNQDYYTTYKDDGYFHFYDNSDTTEIVINSDCTLKEQNYYNQILPLDKINYTSNIDNLDFSLYPQTIILTCKQGYFFSTTPVIRVQRPSVSSLVEDFTLSNNNTVATYIYNHYENYQIEEIETQTEKETIISQDYGLVTLYKPSEDVLKQIANLKFYEYGTNKTLIDLSTYIISILSIPLNIDTIDTKNITLNSIDTGITSDYVNNNIIVLDFGNVDIKGFYNNSLDYTHTDIEIYLAFIGLVKLETSKYINKQLNLKYKIDLFTGDFIAMLIVDNIIIDSFSDNLATEVPYITQAEKSKTISNYKNNNLLDDKISKIIVTSNIANETKLKDTKIFIDKLSDLQGYNVVENFDTSDYLLKIDFENISNLLSQGVIF